MKSRDSDGYTGLSPISVNRESIALAEHLLEMREVTAAETAKVFALPAKLLETEPKRGTRTR